MSDDIPSLGNPDRAQALRRELDELLTRDLDDDELVDQLRQRLDQWGGESRLHVWAPDLYRRDRDRFRASILEYLESDDASPVPLVPDSTQKERLEQWLRELESDGELELFRALYPRTLHERGKKRTECIESDLLERYREADDRREREQVLQMFDVSFGITAETALELYTTDPDASRDFILRHLGRNSVRGAHDYDDAPQWEELREKAQSHEDEELYFELYRRQVPFRQWKIDVQRVVRKTFNPEEMPRKLERRHPIRPLGEEGLGSFFAGIVRKQREAVLPYVSRHLDELKGTGEYEKFFEEANIRSPNTARDQESWKLWAELLLIRYANDEYDRRRRWRSNNRSYNNEIQRVVDRDADSREATLEALQVLADKLTQSGSLRDFELLDETAIAIYELSPSLLHGPFRAQLSVNASGNGASMLERALDADDRELIDELASQIMLFQPEESESDLPDELVDPLISRYTSLLDEPQTFTQRATRVLGRIDDRDIQEEWHPGDSNPLAGLFFERAEELYIDDPASIRDLLEAESSHVRGLAYRILGRDEPEARRLADQHLNLLRACLLARLPEHVRRWGFDALLNAAHDEDNAAAILQQARRALQMPDEHYPKDDLSMLVGRLLQRWPSLRRKAEQPTVYEWMPT